jgi:hypothetical protein
VEREASDIAFSASMTRALDYLWRTVAVQRRSVLFVCHDGRVDSVFVALCTLCQCYHIIPPGQGEGGAPGREAYPQLRLRPAGRGGLSARELEAAEEYVLEMHPGATVTVVMRRALYKTFVEL